MYSCERSALKAAAVRSPMLGKLPQRGSSSAAYDVSVSAPLVASRANTAAEWLPTAYTVDESALTATAPTVSSPGTLVQPPDAAAPCASSSLASSSGSGLTGFSANPTQPVSAMSP